MAVSNKPVDRGTLAKQRRPITFSEGARGGIRGIGGFRGEGFDDEARAACGTRERSGSQLGRAASVTGQSHRPGISPIQGGLGRTASPFRDVIEIEPEVRQQLPSVGNRRIRENGSLSIFEGLDGINEVHFEDFAS